MQGGGSVQGVEGVRRVYKQNGVAVVMFKKFPHCVNGRLAPTLMIIIIIIIIIKKSFRFKDEDDI